MAKKKGYRLGDLQVGDKCEIADHLFRIEAVSENTVCIVSEDEFEARVPGFRCSVEIYGAEFWASADEMVVPVDRKSSTAESVTDILTRWRI